MPVAGVVCFLLASFCETTDIASWHPPVKPLIVPAARALHARCSVDSLPVVCRDLQGESWRLILIVLPGAGM